MSRLIALLLLVAVFCLGAAFSYLNWGQVRFDYLAGEVDVPLVALLLIMLLLGMGLSLLFNAGRVFNLKRENARLRRQLRDTEAELKTLRNIPLKDA